jgi:uncharacterized SAM-binding protein YcdF (DUF218 family)
MNFFRLQTSKHFQRLAILGPDGFGSLLLSIILILTSFGASYLWALLWVYRVARRAPVQSGSTGYLLVPGARLKNGEASHDFRQRLERVLQLDHRGLILVMGGVTSAPAVSEAAIGRDFLTAQGVPAEAVEIEDRSLNTLDNFRAARVWIGSPSADPVVIVSSRYHLARCAVIAEGFGIPMRLCAAESRLVLDARTVARLLWETNFVHWYWVGRTWARLTRNEKMLRRVSSSDS